MMKTLLNKIKQQAGAELYQAQAQAGMPHVAEFIPAVEIKIQAEFHLWKGSSSKDVNSLVAVHSKVQ